jgi:hypothetical protein
MFNKFNPAERRKLIAALTRSQRQELCWKTASINGFTQGLVGIRLRPYQLQAAKAIIKSVFDRDGESFVIIFARQSGKDELLADLILFLLARLAFKSVSIVCAQPTFRPQTVNAMERLYARAHQRPFFVDAGFSKRYGYIYRFMSSRVMYFSAGPSASVVGPTADRLLIINEAQDVETGIYDKRFAPMAASGNATRVFSGTSWTRDTLLEREKQAALELERKDGKKRLFIIDGEQVARHNKFYARYLKNEIRKLGRDHPLIRTQYFCENIDARSGMFTPAHRLLMRSDRFLPSPLGEGPGVRSYTPTAFLLDVAGQEETHFSSGRVDVESFPARDAVTLRIVEIDLSTLESLQAPTYRVIHTQQWTGDNHLTVFGQLKSLAESFCPQHIVMDATGVGEGLWAMLDKAFPSRVIPVKFTQQVKSELAYGFLAIINTGRFRDCVPSELTDRQYAACEAEVLPGPRKLMRWGVPDGRRDENGLLIHDDIPVTDSLTAILDKLDWSLQTEPLVAPRSDPLTEMDTSY